MKKLTFLIGSLALLGVMVALALPLPIQTGVLTGELNANGHAVTNVGSITFADGTVQGTAGAGGSSGTATNLTGTATNQVRSLALAAAQQVVATNALAISNAPNATVILSGTGLPGCPLSVAANTQIGALLYDEAEVPGGILLFDP